MKILLLVTILASIVFVVSRLQIVRSPSPDLTGKESFNNLTFFPDTTTRTTTSQDMTHQGFRGPTGPPHIKGPSGPPPNY